MSRPIPELRLARLGDYWCRDCCRVIRVDEPWPHAHDERSMMCDRCSLVAVGTAQDCMASAVAHSDVCPGRLHAIIGEAS